MKRVAFGELESVSRNYATDQLTQNPERWPLRGSFVSASNRKGLRGVGLSALARRERQRARVVRVSRRPRSSRANNSLTLCAKTAIQLTTLLPSQAEGNAVRNRERGGHDRHASHPLLSLNGYGACESQGYSSR